MTTMATSTAPDDDDDQAATLPGGVEGNEEKVGEEEQEEEIAEEKASDAVGTVALEDLERQYFLGIQERESLKRRLEATEEERDGLLEKVTKLQESHAKLTTVNDEAVVLAQRLATAERIVADATERNDRMQLEQDKLREEIRYEKARAFRGYSLSQKNALFLLVGGLHFPILVNCSHDLFF
jgi:hypothetical protein